MTSGLTVAQPQAVNAVERIGGFPHCSAAMARGDYASDALVVGRNYDDSDAFALLKDDVAVTVCQMVVVPRDLTLWLRVVGGTGWVRVDMARFLTEAA